MFKELLLDALQSLSPEEKMNVRDILEEKISETGEKNKEEEKGEQNMPDKNDKTKVDTSINIDEKTKDNKVDNGSTETSKVDETTKVDETVKTNEEPKKDGEVEKTNDKTDGSEPTDEAQQVQTTETAGNGVRVEDLVTKEELSERLSSLEAKFDAVLKENVDLKDKLSAMEEKYENKDFGNFQRQGVMEKNKEANNSFDEYSKQFM
ncbi:MAG: hypothetical protein IJG09_06605 [Methanobrevibacter sp.]|nr:hypothetical protein [Methanobrevibacter sp.]MBQ2652180.1 hypothetical protein [Methanobrevibacter sp.]